MELELGAPRLTPLRSESRVLETRSKGCCFRDRVSIFQRLLEVSRSLFTPEAEQEFPFGFVDRAGRCDCSSGLVANRIVLVSTAGVDRKCLACFRSLSIPLRHLSPQHQTPWLPLASNCQKVLHFFVSSRCQSRGPAWKMTSGAKIQTAYHPR